MDFRIAFRTNWTCQEKYSKKHPKTEKVEQMHPFSGVERSGTEENGCGVGLLHAGSPLPVRCRRQPVRI